MAAADPPPHGEAVPALKWSASIDRIPVDARRILHRLAGDLWAAMWTLARWPCPSLGAP